jgi:ElaB/YqjD/DUF883 family membrane-anchored ribosome-binding protein
VIKAKNLETAREYQQIIKGLDQEIIVPNKLEDQIAELEKELRLTAAEEQAKQKQNELKLKQQKLLKEAKTQERKDDTRRKILLGAWVLNKLKNDESFKHQLADFEQFLSTESKTEENKLKDKNLFKGLLWDD